MSSWLPRNVSTFGGDVDGIFWLIFYMTAAWFVLTEGLIVYFAFRFRRRVGRRAAYVTGSGWKQLSWVLVPVAVVIVLDVFLDLRGAEVWARIKGQPPPPALVVRGTGKQFNWEFTFPGRDGSFDTPDDLHVENNLHVPAGKVIHVVLTSKDVIHSFFLPHLRLKQDVVPGRQITVWFEATQPGEYEIPCAELCGFGHSGMKGMLYVHTQQDFDKWLAERLAETDALAARKQR
ncbi:MAG TPA: cytochrome c oxidase subunit II [candidate division Zixibacteria bacterium]|nr:cytochrome c oxidase subunit II [candidate division Zixibacteria bacterium]